MQESSRTLALETPADSRKKTVQFNPLTEQHEVVRNNSIILTITDHLGGGQVTTSDGGPVTTSDGGDQLTLCVKHADHKFHMENKVMNCGEEEHVNKSDRK